VEISDDQIEFAVVKRLKAMIDEPPQTRYNVTQRFAMFSTVVLWTKNRTWVAGNDGDLRKLRNTADASAHAVRMEMGRKLITENPWCLPLVAPRIALIDSKAGPANQINADFQNVTAEEFFKWLRDALAHGDGRKIAQGGIGKIHPIHKQRTGTGKRLLAGFRIVYANRTLSLFNDDMRRIGSELADLFCKELSGGDPNFEQAATQIEEVAA
jgi:hypothetical protein